MKEARKREFNVEGAMWIVGALLLLNVALSAGALYESSKASTEAWEARSQSNTHLKWAIGVEEQNAARRDLATTRAQK